MISHPWDLLLASTGELEAGFGPPRYSPALCAGFAPGRQGCDACSRACQHAALTRGANRILIDAESCQRCGACVAACPTGALQRSFAPEEHVFCVLREALEHRSGNLPLAVVHCTHGEVRGLQTRPTRSERVVEFDAPSIHLFSEVHLLALLAMGYRGAVLVGCLRCEDERSLAHPREMVDLANRLLAAWGSRESRLAVASGHDFDVMTSPQSNLQIEGLPYEDRWLPPEGAWSKRELLIDLAQFFSRTFRRAAATNSTHVEGNVRHAEKGHSRDPYGKVTLAEDKCTLCGACSGVCPTGALQMTTGNGLTFREIDCVACGLCVSSCVENAMSVEHRLPQDIPAVLQRQLLKQTAWHSCPKCGCTTYSRDYVQKLEARLAGSPAYLTEENRELLRMCESCKSRRMFGSLSWNDGENDGLPNNEETGQEKKLPREISLPVLSNADVTAIQQRREAEVKVADVSRRDFMRLAASIATAAGFTALSSATAAEETAATRGFTLPAWDPSLIDQNALIRMQVDLARALQKPLAERRWIMVIDLARCVGCHACTIACVAENQLPPGVVYRPVIEEEVGTYPNVRRRFIPRPCMQCDNPPCVPVCPVNATWKREDGITVIDYNKCIGCRYCLTACPYSARTSDFGAFYSDDTPERQPYETLANFEYQSRWNRTEHGSPIGNARKCHFCIHRIEEGMLPACVTTCIGVATYFGDANDPQSLVSELIASSRVTRLKEEMGTKPRVYYLM